MLNYLKPTTIALHGQQQSNINFSVKGSKTQVLIPEQDVTHPRHHHRLEFYKKNPELVNNRSIFLL
jgi:hypothetical protein